jgi:hypothetical protein
VGGGVFVEIGDILTVNAGVVFVMYDDYTRNYTSPVSYTEIYKKETTLFAVGVDISL